MKIAEKLFSFTLLMALMLLPLQAVQAKGLDEGPIFGSNYTLKSGNTLNDDLIVIGGSISVEKNARVNGSIILIGGSLTLDGEVSQDVVIVGGAVKLGADTHVHGKVITYNAPVNRDLSAVVDGGFVDNPVRPESPVSPTAPPIPWLVTAITDPIQRTQSVLGQSILLALLAALIAMFMPVQMRRVADAVVAQPFITFGMGLLTLVMFIVAIVALALFSVFIITLFVTIPLITVIAIVFAAACILGWLALGMEVGLRISQMFPRELPLPLATGLGAFGLSLLTFIPCLGGPLSGIVGFIGLGAVLMTRFGMRPAMLSLTPTVIDAVPPVRPVN
jgi:hypothetical protein